MSDQATKIPTVFDSDEQQIGEVYARALLGAVPSDKIDSVVQEFESLVVDVLDKHPGLEIAFANPKMTVDQKSQLLDRVFGGKMNPTLLTFLKVLGRRQRLNSVRAIQGATSKLADEMAGRILAVVTVSQPLSPDVQRKLEEKLTGIFRKDVRLQTKVDPGILGGLVIRVDDTVYDGSVDGQLKALRKVVSQRAENAVRAVAGSLVSSSD